MDEEAETYRLWRVRKTVMQVCVCVCVGDTIARQSLIF